jgi:low temperature requirement protein LtrA
VSPSERRTSSVELLWDLVFVFAITQVTTLLSRHLSWAGFGKAVLLLALVWWAWSAFVWAANAEADDSRVLRVSLLAAACLIFVSGLALPDAFGSAPVLFAVSYSLVRLLHLVLYADASYRGNATWSAITGFAVTVAIGMGLLIAGSLVEGAARIALWSVAVAIDYAGPGWLTRKRLRGLQQVAVAHFSERYGLFVIICLGESIVAIGVGAGTTHKELTAGLVAVVTLALATTVAMWWTYFDRLARSAEAALRRDRDPVLAASDGYSYLHLVIVAGIIVFAAGIRLLVAQVSIAPTAAVRLAVCGGVAAYLIGCVLFSLRLLGAISYPKLLVAGALLVLFAAGGSLAAWTLTAVIAVLLALLCAIETRTEPRLVGLSGAGPDAHVRGLDA